MIKAIRCFLLGHRFEDKGDPHETGTWAPYPAIGELEQPQVCIHCGKYRARYAGFVWDVKE